MLNFVLNMLLWTLALYGLIEIIKRIYCICTYTNLKTEGIYLIIATKNQEDKIEAFIRSVLFRIIYGKEEYIKNIIVSDLNSSDNTLKILQKLQIEYKDLKIADWKTCKEIIENIENN